ncbi:inositol monophosphatase family protein [Microbacterium sp. TNHR37B]|uniref:inositol monophosphatase family protein n=1 Tax=Microbacterium sp. TNHR37B TaxID=1775956 RepID=UPI0007B2FB84|nr:inositol monophosphatase family protein [Microbacterium sp. TNHR37B]KZE91949.1 Inositol-1-monophosphatase [Microbacterium sp. TNHR37B]
MRTPAESAPVDELWSLAIEVAREAGALARQRRSEGVEVAATKSTIADVVTEADREVEALIRRRLVEARPADGFLGEESGLADSPDTGEASEITWVVDPIDGTVNYLYGLPHYAVSIAAVRGRPDPREWEALVGVVVNPATQELFRAAAGRGAWLDDTRLAVSTPGEAGALIATGFGYDPATHDGDFARLRRVMPLARDIRRGGAASLDLAFVAAGRLDGYFERGLHAWDHAAGGLLVTEAGGRLGGMPGGAPGREMTIAAGAELFDRISDAVYR